MFTDHDLGTVRKNEGSDGTARMLGDSNFQINTARGPTGDEDGHNQNALEGNEIIVEDEQPQMKVEINHRPNNYRKRNFI